MEEAVVKRREEKTDGLKEETVAPKVGKKREPHSSQCAYNRTQTHTQANRCV